MTTGNGAGKSLKFILDGTLVGTLNTNIWADIYLPITGIPVNGVGNGTGGIFDLPKEQIRSPSAPIDDKVSPFMQGVSEVNDRLLVVLDLNQLLLATDMQQFQ